MATTNHPEFNAFQMTVNTWLSEGYVMQHPMLSTEQNGFIVMLNKHDPETNLVIDQKVVMEHDGDWMDSYSARAIHECGGCGKDWFERDLTIEGNCPLCGYDCWIPF